MRSDAARGISVLTTTAWRLDRRRVMVHMVLSLVNGVIGSVGLLLLVPIVNSIADTGTTVEVPLIGPIGLGDTPLPVLLVCFVTLVATQALLARTAAIGATRLQNVVVDALRHDAFAAVLRARWTFVTSMRKSDIVQVITVGSQRAGTATNLLMTGVVSAVLAVATAAVAIAVSPGVAAVAIVAVVVFAIVQGTGVAPSRRLGQQFSTRSRDVQAVVTDSLDSLRLVRAHNASQVWIDRLVDAFTAARDVQIATTERMATVSAVSSVGTAAAAAVLVWVCVQVEVEPTAIVVILFLISRLSRQAQGVVRIVIQLANQLPAVEEVNELVDAATAAAEIPPSTVTRTRTLEVAPGEPLVEMRGVTYHHAGTQRGVTDVDLLIRCGAVTALTGPSGAGKSTTADLVLGLLSSQHGEVLVGGETLTVVDLSWWRDHIAYVPQETVLIPGSLRENLIWSAGGEVTDSDCWEALDRAAADFAHGLADGLDTMLGDRGVRLSGGERQRVAIARALLRRPVLLVLDEATASLDDETESAVLDTVTALAPAVTVLVIAHRRSTIDLADHVIRLADGRCV